MRRTIIFSEYFDRCVEALGGYRAVDIAIEVVVDGLSRNPFAFEKFESDDHSFRFARTRPVGDMPELWIAFTIGTDKTVTLEWIEVVERY